MIYWLFCERAHEVCVLIIYQIQIIETLVDSFTIEWNGLLSLWKNLCEGGGCGYYALKHI